MKNQNLIVGCAVTAVVVGGISFWGGTMYQKSRTVPNFQNRLGERGMMQGQNNGGNSATRTMGTPQGQQMGRGGAVTGEVTAKDDKSITIKMNDGSSRIVILSSNTTYRISSESAAENVEVGKQVAVFGTTNSDGSTTAASIEINPALMGQMAK